MEIVITLNSIEEMEQFVKQMSAKTDKTETEYATTTPAIVAAPINTPKPVQEQPAPQAAPKRTVTRQEIQGKAIALMDAGKQDQLQALLTKYGVQALPSIPEDRLAAFMADLEAV